MMRLFIAIELSEELREALSHVQAHLKYSGADVKWVEPENIHLTLKFLGEVPEAKVGEIAAVLDEAGRKAKPFELSLKDVGAFPRIESPRVIWVGLDKGANESKVLAEAIDEKLSRIGFARESRPFAAHLTVGRVRSPKNTEVLKEKFRSANLQLTAYRLQLISSIILFQSTLTPSGPIYAKLHETKLTG